MEFKEYITERMMNMYTAYDSVILEGYDKKEQAEHTKMCKKAFLNYLEIKYGDADIRYEIKSAETQKEREKVVKKYMKDFEEWKKHNTKVNVELVGMYVSSFLGFFTGNITYFIVFFLFYGMLVKDGQKLLNKREDIEIKKYKEKNKK